MGRSLASSAYEAFVSLAKAHETKAARDDWHGDTEWRTPPLWGLAASTPYMHDGRSATIAEAIEAHDGQGLASSQTFKNMASIDRLSLLMFLSSLEAPQPADAIGPRDVEPPPKKPAHVTNRKTAKKPADS